MRRLGLLLLLLLQACSHKPPVPQDQAFIAPGLSIAVPGPEAIGKEVLISQTVTAQFRGESYVMQGYLNLGPTSLELAALDGFGRRLFTISWRGNAFDYQPTPAMPSELRPANMLADIALIYWPADALRPVLAPAGATLTETAASRSISFGGREVIHIDYETGIGWTGHTAYRNLAFGYSLDIRSVEVPP
jgi:hypothetical protein